MITVVPFVFDANPELNYLHSIISKFKNCIGHENSIAFNSFIFRHIDLLLRYIDSVSRNDSSGITYIVFKHLKPLKT